MEGFPRSLAQAEALEQLLYQSNQPCDLVVYFEVTHQVAKERILHHRRQHDTEEIIQKHFLIFQQQSLPILDFYRHCQNLYPINGNLPIESMNRLLKISLESASADTTDCIL